MPTFSHPIRVLAMFSIWSTLGACASTKAIEAGTCGDDELLQLQQVCIQSGCSYESSKSATGMDSCAGDADVGSQTGSAECAMQGSGSCSIVCSCEDDGSATCGQWGWNDCLVERPPRAAELECTGTLGAAYDNGYCLCEEEYGMNYCEPF